MTKITNRLFSMLHPLLEQNINCNKMSWDSKKSLLFFQMKMHNTGHFVKIGLHLLLPWWFALNHGIVYQGPRVREDHSFGPWDHILLSPSKTPIDLDTQHFFLVDCVDIFSQYPRAERVITRPEMCNHDHNFTHKDPNCCHKFCTFSSQQIFSETSFTSKKAFFQEKIKA